jgi:flagellar motor switch protein FliG
MSGLRKAAVLMVLLGDDAASDVYRVLGPADVEKLTQAITEVNYIGPEVAESVLEEYLRLSITQDYLSQGGAEYATNLLIKAFGEHGAKELLDQVMRSQEARAGNLDSLQGADPQQLAKFLEGEHPQTVALILAHLGPKSASSLLLLLPEARRAEAIRRLAEMRQFPPEMAQKISMVLHKKLESLGEQSRRGYAGFEAVAELLNRIEPNTSKIILETIEQENAQIAISIRNLMFTFEDLLTVPEAGIRELLSQVDKKNLAMALKSASPGLKSHALKCLSSRAAAMLEEDMEVLGPVRARDVAAAQQTVVDLARRLEAEGKMILKAESEEYVV